MIELPEAIEISRQLNETIQGKKVTNVTAAQTPHKFAWYHGDPDQYHNLLTGKTIGSARGVGAMVEIKVEDAVILFSEGVSVRYHGDTEKHPKKHQLLIEFDDYSAISGSIQMYGGLFCFRQGEFDNWYYSVAQEKPSPMSEKFDQVYFDNIVSDPKNSGLSAKALLATEQRIPGLGNGVLQDILLNAGIHPKRKVKTFTEQEKLNIFNSVKSTLAEMTFQGGRDTERDLFGCYGGYKTKLSKNTVGNPCPVCGEIIKKETYLGGSIYFCPGCQKL